ncbi:MAG: nucleotidyltransferase family protein [Aquimonas sp.]|nr:nucleotidyltransferase family protein [Aquimonas sp.]
MSAIEAAFILAAGRGERMRPLTDSTPKPLLRVGGKRLIEWHLEALARAGVRRVVINTAHLAECFEPALGDGARYGLTLRYSREAERLETGGGLLNALPLIEAPRFLLVNGDVFCDVDYARFALAAGDLAELLMVDNPPQHPRGDFHLDGRRLQSEGEPRMTYAGIGLFDARLLEGWQAIIGDTDDSRRQPPRFPLAPLLRAHMAQGRIAGLHHRGRWEDVGTPQRLAALDAALRASEPHGPG